MALLKEKTSKEKLSKEKLSEENLSKEKFSRSLTVLKSLVSAIWSSALRLRRRSPGRLRLCESLQLGERRFVAVVEFEGERFLLGGTSASLVLLSRLRDSAGKRETRVSFTQMISESNLPREVEPC